MHADKQTCLCLIRVHPRSSVPDMLSFAPTSLEFQNHRGMIGHLLLALGVRVAAGGDPRQQAWGSESMIEAEAVGRGAALGQGIPGVLRGIAVEVAPHIDPA